MEKKMTRQMETDYENSIDFWNKALSSAPEDYRGEIDCNEAWEQIGSEKLIKLLCEQVKGWDHVLDFGCGRGWALAVLVKNDAGNVTGVDVAPNAIASAGYYAKAFQIEDKVTLEAVSTDWLGNQEENLFQHAISINVLDVVPDEVAEEIIRGLYKVCKKGATLLIGMNPCFEGAELTREGFSYRDHYLYVNGILRVNNHTDEEWSRMLSKYFTIDRLEHFKWDQETDERRRLFYLTKK